MKIGVFFFGSIYEKTGAGKVVRSFVESKELFLKKGIEENVYDFSPNNISIKVDPISKTIKSCKVCIRDILGRSLWGAKFCIDKLYFQKGLTVLNKYLASRQDEDILIFHEIFTCYAYVNYCRKFRKETKKIILVLHTNGEIFKMLKIYFPKIIGTKYEQELDSRAKICLEKASKVIFVSKMSSLNFQNIFSAYKNKAYVVYNGIIPLTIESNPQFDGTINMVTVGTVNARKNQIMQIDCLAHILRQYEATLTIVGGGDKLNSCKQRAKELGIMNKVVFLGPCDDVPKILNKCNLFVMSSFDEGLPISAIEALRCKLPVILTDVGGNRELLWNNGYLVKPEVEEITNAILAFAKDIEKQKEMSLKSYQLFKEKFSLESMVEGYVKIIKLIV